MIIVIVAAISLAIALGLAVWLFVLVRSGFGDPVSKIEDLEGRIEAIDAIAFRTLVDPSETQFLRDRLAAGTYRKIQRLRTRAAIAYVWSVYRNAGVTTRLAQHLTSSHDVTVRKEAERIQELSVQSRFLAIKSLLKLVTCFAFPSLPVSLQDLTSSYTNIAERIEALCTLTAPLHASRIRAAFR